LTAHQNPENIRNIMPRSKKNKAGPNGPGSSANAIPVQVNGDSVAGPTIREPPLRKERLGLDFSDSEDDEDAGAGNGGFGELKVNEEYARRFEHNKKREELQRREHPRIKILSLVLLTLRFSGGEVWRNK
jgi:hypothetical protein